MADNIAVTQGSGTTLASDDIAGVQYPRVKLVIGTNGSNDGDVSSATPMPISDNGGSLTVDGSVSLGAAVPAGTNVIGYVGLEPRTSGGLSMATAILGSSTNSTVVKASAGQVFSIQAFNKSSSIRYLKLYNKATSPDETDTPVKVLVIPASTDGAGLILDQPQGLAFSTGIAYRVTGGIANNDTTSTSANDGTISLDYK